MKINPKNTNKLFLKIAQQDWLLFKICTAIYNVWFEKDDRIRIQILFGLKKSTESEYEY